VDCKEENYEERRAHLFCLKAHVYADGAGLLIQKIDSLTT
jgi:hypothetical protein